MKVVRVKVKIGYDSMVFDFRTWGAASEFAEIALNNICVDPEDSGREVAVVMSVVDKEDKNHE